MRWTAIGWIVLSASCRPTSGSPTADAATLSVGATRVAATKTPVAPNFARPVTARRVDGGISVVARERATDALAFVRLDDRSPDAPIVAALPISVEDPELVTSSADLGLLGRSTTDGGSSRIFLHIAWDGDAGVKPLDVSAIGTAACSTLDGVYSIGREASGWRGTYFPLTALGGETSGPILDDRSETTLVCGQHRAFVVTNAGGELRAIAWSPSAHDSHSTVVAARPSSIADGDMLMAAMDDELVIGKFETQALSTLVWPGTPGISPWRNDPSAAREGRALEAIEPGHGQIGVLFVRTITKVKGCARGEATDAVAEVALVDAASGKLVRVPEPVETWRCGAEPGPFFSGWTSDRFVVAWPRGPDPSCARAGMRRGGLGYATIDSRTGRAHVGRVSRPAEAIVDAGCDATQCYAVALTRGPNPCDDDAGPADAGRLEVITYP